MLPCPGSPLQWAEADSRARHPRPSQRQSTQKSVSVMSSLVFCPEQSPLAFVPETGPPVFVPETGWPCCRSCQTVLAAVLRGLLAALGPILPHLAEDAWQSLSPALTQGQPSVFQAGWLEPQQAWSAIPDWEVSTAESLKTIRDHVNAVSTPAPPPPAQPHPLRCRNCRVVHFLIDKMLLEMPPEHPGAPPPPHATLRPP